MQSTDSPHPAQERQEVRRRGGETLFWEGYFTLKILNLA